MLDLTAYAPWSQPEHLDLSTYVPNAHALFTTLSFCDNEMLSTDRFTRGHPHWSPFVSRLYFSMLFYFRILDCMVLSGLATSTELNLLLEIKNTFDFRRLTVPGPLVPFFQSISVCSSGHELLGDVSPRLPHISHCTPGHHYSLDNISVPNVPALVDMIASSIYATTPSDDYTHVSHTVSRLFGAAIGDTANDDIRNVLSTPGLTHDPMMTNQHRLTQHRARDRLPMPRVPAPADITQTHALSWPQFFRFTALNGERQSHNHRQWFTSVIGLMNEYSCYFTESSSLGLIPVAAGASPLVQCQYTASTNSKTTPGTYAVHSPSASGHPAHYALPEITSLDLSALCNSPAIPDTHLQIATLAATNAQLDGTNNSARHGRVWTMSPTTFTLSRFDVYANLPAYISHLHRSRALE
jgi:hypothetical protein